LSKAKRNTVLNRFKIVLPSLVVGLLVINHSASIAKEYDGIWFMGFNLKHELLQNDKVRGAIIRVIDREYSEETAPISIIPPGMLGYDPDLGAQPHDTKEAKAMMKEAGYPINDERIKKLSILHTDGVKTIAMAERIINNLKNIGMKVEATKVSFENEEEWVEELTSGNHDFFLMGYKAGISQLFTEEANAARFDSYSLIEPLFASSGEANFTGYSKAEVDNLLAKLTGINLALQSERHIKLKQINQLLAKDLPVVVLFYIEKL